METIITNNESLKKKTLKTTFFGGGVGVGGRSLRFTEKREQRVHKVLQKLF